MKMYTQLRSKEKRQSNVAQCRNSDHEGTQIVEWWVSNKQEVQREQLGSVQKEFFNYFSSSRCWGILGLIWVELEVGGQSFCENYSRQGRQTNRSASDRNMGSRRGLAQIQKHASPCASFSWVFHCQYRWEFLHKVQVSQKQHTNTIMLLTRAHHPRVGRETRTSFVIGQGWRTSHRRWVAAVQCCPPAHQCYPSEFAARQNLNVHW